MKSAINLPAILLKPMLGQAGTEAYPAANMAVLGQGGAVELIFIPVLDQGAAVEPVRMMIFD